MQYMSAPERRTTFDQVPELYDRVRPGYPPELFDDLELVAGLTPDSSVLEIGPATGQAPPLCPAVVSLIAKTMRAKRGLLEDGRR